MSYRYRFEESTYRAMGKVVPVLAKLGKLKEIWGHRYFGRHQTSHEAILIRGENGSARLSGFLWGYRGEGPQGLVSLLKYLGATEEWAQKFVFETPRTMKLGSDWKLDFSSGLPWEKTDVRAT